MLELRVQVDPRLADALSACLFDAGAGGVEEREDDTGLCLVTYGDEAEIEALRQATEEFRRRVELAVPDAEVGSVTVKPASNEWQRTWLDALRPAQLTETFVARPTHQKPAPPEENTLWFEPDTCFGAGSHPTTRLAACALEQLCRMSPGTSVLDVGTGSGILCFVALRSGASRAVGTDIDPRAVSAARNNAALNNLESACEFSDRQLDSIDERFAVVAANIDPDTLCRLAPDLRRRLGPNGTLLLTGVLEERADEVRRAMASEQLTERASTRADGWILLTFEQLSPPSP